MTRVPAVAAKNIKSAMESKKIILTLCIIHQNGKILLGMKKRGLGKGLWNGFGGKLENNETIEEALEREVQEEIRVKVLDLNKVGIIGFEFENNSETLEVHIFKGRKFKRKPKETEEMIPKWFSISEIPYNKMWSDDIYWLPLFLKGKKFRGEFLFDMPSNDKYTSKILKQELEEVDMI